MSYIDGTISLQQLIKAVNPEIELDFDVSFTWFIHKNYVVMYANMGNGVVLYWFNRIDPETNLKEPVLKILFAWLFEGDHLECWKKWGNGSPEPIPEPPIPEPPIPEPPIPDPTPSPTYAWRNGAIVLLSTGMVVLSAKNLNTIIQFARCIKYTNGTIGNRNIHGNGIVSPYKSMEQAADLFIKAIPHRACKRKGKMV